MEFLKVKGLLNEKNKETERQSGKPDNKEETVQAKGEKESV